ncbi:putative prolyl 4-hydroxylase 3 [Dichanthelium oligosanthes]|uniref:Putative prolyl 4-hydroxylase 3 n=1 Tax=Dichanthelium oligosanthes TaxID=888268 RepID=A0A1E5W2B8_9POAL|nr:putative prolyl 4-hydroxylase 3 [Dichanthelium oligosanthes]
MEKVFKFSTMKLDRNGGETVFPNAPVNSSSLPFYNELSECAKKGLSVKPKMGDALLFWSMKPDGSLDPASLHGEIT